MKRRVEPEHIDADTTPTPRLEYLLRCVRTTNRRLGGVDCLLDHLKAWSVRWPKGRRITLLDIGTGSADLPLAAVQWARAAGHNLKVVGIDANVRVLELASRLCADEPDVELMQCDAMDLIDESRSPFHAQSFDYVHAGMFIHHLDDATVPRMLVAMNRIARAGVIWNDLIRSRRGYAISWLVTLGQAIHHDCLASLRAGFRDHEVLTLARQAGLDYTTHRERYLYQRFTLSGERPGAWYVSRDQALPLQAAAMS